MDSTTIYYTPILCQALCYICTTRSEFFSPERVLIKMPGKGSQKEKQAFIFNPFFSFFLKGACEGVIEI